MLRGVASSGTAPKILKEYGVGEFRRVKRAVAAASRLRHPGVVPVECAFLERAICTCIWYMVYGIWYVVYGTWYMVHGIWYVYVYV